MNIETWKLTEGERVGAELRELETAAEKAKNHRPFYLQEGERIDGILSLDRNQTHLSL